MPIAALGFRAGHKSVAQTLAVRPNSGIGYAYAWAVVEERGCGQLRMPYIRTASAGSILLSFLRRVTR